MQKAKIGSVLKIETKSIAKLITVLAIIVGYSESKMLLVSLEDGSNIELSELDEVEILDNKEAYDAIVASMMALKGKVMSGKLTPDEVSKISEGIVKIETTLDSILIQETTESALSDRENVDNGVPVELKANPLTESDFLEEETLSECLDRSFQDKTGEDALFLGTMNEVAEVSETADHESINATKKKKNK